MKRYLFYCSKKIWSVVLFGVMVFMIQIPVLSEFDMNYSSQWFRLVTLTLTFSIAFLCCYKYLDKISDKSCLKFSLKNPEHKTLILWICILDIAILAVFLLLMSLGFFPHSGNSGSSDFLMQFTKDPIYFIVYATVLCVTQPLLEELLFRCALLGSLKKYSLILSLLGTSLIFAYVHGFDNLFIKRFISGVLYGWLFQKTERAWPSVLCHMFHNSILLVLALLS